MRPRIPALWLFFVAVASVGLATEPVDETSQLCAAFQDHSGIEIVFDRDGLPPGNYYDILLPLPEARRPAALKIAIREVRKLPRHFLRDVGLKTIGIFDVCASRQGDGYRPYDDQLKGYRYFGIYNGKDAVAAAYYTDEQLPLTFHHEIFHHIDALNDPESAKDERLAEILAGTHLYPALRVAPPDLARLKQASEGILLTDAVSKYAEKNPAEDKAETARHVMSTLADSLVQVVERPELPGSQRILHVLARYRRALDGNGPSANWFVDVALSGQPTTIQGDAPTVENPYTKYIDDEIEDPALRHAMRLVQPACVRLGNASGVNVSPLGRILTAAHVARRLDIELTAEFPDGRKFKAVCTAIDHDLDLAMCNISTEERLPSARVAGQPPRKGLGVVCIGQPGNFTPEMKPTKYHPFHVSTGEIRGFLGDPLGSQRLGRTKHDAWTYWGHSGSPLFNKHGQIVAIHNSWDPSTRMRHAVTQQAIVTFLRHQGLGQSIAFESSDSD